MMADEFNFLWSQIQNNIAEADADLIPVQADAVSCCFGALFVADLTVGMEELELRYRLKKIE